MTRHPKPSPAAAPGSVTHGARRASTRPGSGVRLHAALSLLILVGALLAFWWVGK